MSGGCACLRRHRSEACWELQMPPAGLCRLPCLHSLLHSDSYSIGCIQYQQASASLRLNSDYACMFYRTNATVRSDSALASPPACSTDSIILNVNFTSRCDDDIVVTCLVVASCTQLFGVENVTALQRGVNGFCRDADRKRGSRTDWRSQRGSERERESGRGNFADAETIKGVIVDCALRLRHT